MDQKLVSPGNNEYLFKAKDKLGEGAFGEVYKGTDMYRNAVAIKRVNKSVLDRYGEEFVRCVGSEVNILQEFGKTDHIVAIYDCFATQNCINIIMEFCNGGTLKEVMDKMPGGHFTEEQAVKYFNEIVEGLYALHSTGRMHRDLKLENIFLKDGKCKLGDFGFATKHETSSQYAGTPEYMAPEIFEVGDGKTYNKAVDIWALGVMFHQMLFGDTPYKGSQMQLPNIIKNNPYKVPASPVISQESAALLQRMFVIDPKKRITIQEIKGECSPTPSSMRNSSEDFQLPEELKLSLTQSLAEKHKDRIFTKLDNYKQGCAFYLKFFGSLRNLMKKNPAFEELHVMAYYLLNFIYHQSKFLLDHLNSQECPKKLFKPVEVDYWYLFVKSDKFEPLRNEMNKRVELTQQIFHQFRKNELTNYLVKAEKNPYELLENLYTENIENDCNATFKGKLLNTRIFLQKFSQKKNDPTYEDAIRLLLDIDFIGVIDESMQHYDIEIDFQTFTANREGSTSTLNFDVKQYIRMKSWN